MTGAMNHGGIAPATEVLPSGGELSAQSLLSEEAGSAPAVETVAGAAPAEQMPIHELASLANRAHEACESSLRDGLHHALRAGEYLTQAKALCTHGEWLPWLRDHFVGSERLAQAYIRVARDPQRVAGLTLRDALRQLAEPRGAGNLAPLMSSDTVEWYTPTHIIDSTLAVLGSIDLDPCADEGRSVPAAEHFTREDDGLAQAWHGKVYMNPPYGDEIARWVQKLAEQYDLGNVTEAIALVPARTDTRWWKFTDEHPVCFISGRLKFSDHENGAPFPSAIVALGISAQLLAQNFADLGQVRPASGGTK